MGMRVDAFGVSSPTRSALTPQRGMGSEEPRLASSTGEATAGVQSSFSPESLAKASAVTSAKAGSGAGGQQELSQEEQREVQELKQRDTEVRQHEQAHLSAAGAYARGGASYTYTTGPDGKRYATGGEVSISVGPGRTPQETIEKAEVARRAALAPANPSPQDRSVAAEATKLEQSARMEMAKQGQAAGNTGKPGSGDAGTQAARGVAGQGAAAGAEGRLDIRV